MLDVGGLVHSIHVMREISNLFGFRATQMTALWYRTPGPEAAVATMLSCHNGKLTRGKQLVVTRLQHQNWFFRTHFQEATNVACGSVCWLALTVCGALFLRRVAEQKRSGKRW